MEIKYFHIYVHTGSRASPTILKDFHAPSDFNNFGLCCFGCALQ